MTRTGNLREAFDRDRFFVTVKPVTLNGRKFGPGQPFDKTLVTTRRLRQLYDTRYLGMTSAPAQLREPPQQPAPDIGNKVPENLAFVSNREPFGSDRSPEPAAKPVKVKRVKLN